MKKELGAILLLAALMLTAAWNIRHADFLIAQISLNLDRAERAAEREDYALARTAVTNALALWQNARGYTSVFLRHPDADSVSDAFFDLQELLLEEEAAEAGFSKLRYHLDMLGKMERLSLGTVF